MEDSPRSEGRWRRGGAGAAAVNWPATVGVIAVVTIVPALGLTRG
jgi:hypothetical protein